MTLVELSRPGTTASRLSIGANSDVSFRTPPFIFDNIGNDRKGHDLGEHSYFSV
jgi:hypothetical protein